jgi:ABC-type transport system involved in multi-copper enzyme maturation permease subunit
MNAKKGKANSVRSFSSISILKMTVWNQNKRTIIVSVVLVLMIILVVQLAFFSANLAAKARLANITPTPTLIPTVVPTSVPTATPSATLKATPTSKSSLYQKATPAPATNSGTVK